MPGSKFMFFQESPYCIQIYTVALVLDFALYQSFPLIICFLPPDKAHEFKTGNRMADMSHVLISCRSCDRKLKNEMNECRKGRKSWNPTAKIQRKYVPNI